MFVFLLILTNEYIVDTNFILIRVQKLFIFIFMFL
jgi:hypothetical protein